MSGPDRHRGGADDGASGLATVFLPPLIPRAGAAVLVLDLQRREVTYANDLAAELVPDCVLPVSVDAWTVAAGLECASEDDQADGLRDQVTPAESLLRIAAGEPVTGTGVTVQRGTPVARSREPLWAIGAPLSGAPEPISSLAVLAFLPARNAWSVAGAQESATTLRDRAMLATEVSFTITDPGQDDNPLVWVNPAFTETTGYTADEVIGRNCRFLQGEGTDLQVVDQIRVATAAERPLTTTLLNYRKDGTPFWNELSMSPIRDSFGTVTHFVGVQADVTVRVEAQRGRDAALSQRARAADRLALLADFSSRMALSTQPHQIVALLAEVLVPRIGTWSIVYTLEEGNRLARPVVQHERAGTDPAVAADLAALVAVVPDQLTPGSPVWRVLDGSSRHVLISDYDAEAASVSGSADDERTSLMHKLGLRSVAAVPLLARSGILGCVALIADDSRPPLGREELDLLLDLSARAGLMLENAQLYARQQAAAATLQRSLLPRLPKIDGIDVAACYVPSADEAAVGGDWYDVFPLKDDGVGVVVGDVMGHNYDSAARMGKLSTIVRAYAWPGIEPRVVLTAVDELLAGSRGQDILATCLLATLQLRPAGGATLRYSSAGHLPALLRDPDGAVRVLPDGRGPMIGIAQMLHADQGRPEDASVELAAGSTLICFTDGLIDAYSGDGDIDAGVAELARRAESLPVDIRPDRLVDLLTAGSADAKDDVAVVAIRIH